jgi:hypothetical protein
LDWGLNSLAKDLRETTDLSTIEADDRNKAIERLEAVITMARACIDALETNDKNYIDPDFERDSAKEDQDWLDRHRDDTTPPPAAAPEHAPPTVPADDDGPVKVDRKVIKKALKKVGNDQRKIKPSDVIPRS